MKPLKEIKCNVEDLSGKVTFEQSSEGSRSHGFGGTEHSMKRGQQRQQGRRALSVLTQGRVGDHAAGAE